MQPCDEYKWLPVSIWKKVKRRVKVCDSSKDSITLMNWSALAGLPDRECKAHRVVARICVPPPSSDPSWMLLLFYALLLRFASRVEVISERGSMKPFGKDWNSGRL